MEHDLEIGKKSEIDTFGFWANLGLKIDFHKSELYCFGEAQDHTQLYAELFGCNHGEFPIRYLGILIHFWRLKKCWIEIFWGKITAVFI
jgi:hypothetical protein